MQDLPKLHVIAGYGVLAAEDYPERLGPIVAAGGGELALHLRARSASARRLFEVARWLSGASRNAGTSSSGPRSPGPPNSGARAPGPLVVVNDRVDIALAAGAHGAHLREDSLPVSVARRVAAGRRSAGERLWLGRSVHSPEQAARLGASGQVDYLVLGAVYPTRSHPDRQAIGVGAVAEAAAGSDAPVLAIGGVTPERVPDVLARGAHGVVVLSGVWRAERPERAVARYLEAVRGAP